MSDVKTQMTGIDIKEILEYAKTNEIEISLVVDGVFSYDPCVKIQITDFVNHYPITNEVRLSGIINNPSSEQRRIVMSAISEQFNALREYENKISESIVIKAFYKDGEARKNDSERDV